MSVAVLVFVALYAYQVKRKNQEMNRPVTDIEAV